MSARSLRRAAERQAAKSSRTASGTTGIAQTSPVLSTQYTKQGEGQRTPPTPEDERVSGVGPQPAAGKSASSWLSQPSPQGVSLPVVRVPARTGLTGIFRVRESESQELFDELRDALRTEHAPATPTEILLVDRLAEHVWLSQRAQRIADAALTDFEANWLALMLRYRTTHDRAFHKCLAELRTLRQEREKREQEERERAIQCREQAPQFESQKSPAAVAAAAAGGEPIFITRPLTTLPEVKPVNAPPEFTSSNRKKHQA